MTVKELKAIINSISSRDDDRNVSFAGNLLIEHAKPFDDAEISWIDCSDAILILINEVT